MALNLTERAMLVSLNQKEFSNSKVDKKATREYHAQKNINEKSGKYIKYIIRPDYIEHITTFMNSVRTWHYANTLAWEHNGFQILPAANYPAYRDFMQSAAQTLEQMLCDFIRSGNYGQAIIQAQQDHNGNFDALQYPSDMDFMKAFSIKTKIKGIDNAADFRVSLQGEDIDAIRAEIERDTQDCLTVAVNKLYKRVHKVINHMAEEMSKKDDPDSIIARTREPRIAWESLLENVKELADLLPKLNITNDPELDRIGQEMRDKLCRHSANDLRDNRTARVETTDEARKLAEAMSGYFSTPLKLATV